MEFSKKITNVIVKLTILENNQTSKPANAMAEVKETN